MDKDFDWTLFIDSLWERENAKGKRGMEGKGGFKKGKYYPYITPSGNNDIGPGLDLDKQTPEFVARAQKGFTKAELDSIVKARLKDERNHFNERIVKEGGDPKKVNDNVLAGLYDMYWQIKNGLYQEYPKFWKGVAANDYKKMQDESATYYTPANGKMPKDAIVKNGKVLDKGRWDYRKATYFKEPENTTQSSPNIQYDSEFLKNWNKYKNTLPKGTPAPVYGDKVPVMAEGGKLDRPKNWNDLSIKEKSEMMKVAIENGITNISEIKQRYNEFALGGDTKQEETTEYVYDVLPKMLKNAGLDVKVTSGYREAGAAGNAGNKSWHTKHGAVDIVPVGKTTFDDIEYALYNHPQIAAYMQTNNLGLIDESGRSSSSRDIMKRTGATGAHFHIGKDTMAVRNYNNASSFTPSSNIIYGFNPLTAYENTAPVTMPIPSHEEPVIEDALKYNAKALERQERQERLQKFGMMFNMLNPGKKSSLLNTINMLSAGNGYANDSKYYKY